MKIAKYVNSNGKVCSKNYHSCYDNKTIVFKCLDDTGKEPYEIYIEDKDFAYGMRYLYLNADVIPEGVIA